MDRLKLSRTVSHALRHEPWVYELELDEGGWVPLEALLDALRPLDSSWKALDESDLKDMIALSAKVRHEIRGGYIRAKYGHSTPQAIRPEQSVPPAVLFHGTTRELTEAILREGLRPMSRQFVHLSADIQSAREVALRKSARPIVLNINAEAASLDGLRFYRGNDIVWLSNVVPAIFISVHEKTS